MDFQYFGAGISLMQLFHMFWMFYNDFICSGLEGIFFKDLCICLKVRRERERETVKKTGPGRG